MRIISFATIATALLITGPAFAQGNGQAAAAATTAAAAAQATKPKQDEKVCKRLETSGTRMAERVCLTKEEWKKVEQLD